MGKDIEFGKPALYIETSSEDLVLVSNIILFYFFRINFIISRRMFSKRKIIIINFEFRLSSLPPPPLNGIEPSLITN